MAIDATGALVSSFSGGGRTPPRFAFPGSDRGMTLMYRVNSLKFDQNWTLEAHFHVPEYRSKGSTTILCRGLDDRFWG